MIDEDTNNRATGCPERVPGERFVRAVRVRVRQRRVRPPDGQHGVRVGRHRQHDHERVHRKHDEVNTEHTHKTVPYCSAAYLFNQVDEDLRDEGGAEVGRVGQERDRGPRLRNRAEEARLPGLYREVVE